MTYSKGHIQQEAGIGVHIEELSAKRWQLKTEVDGRAQEVSSTEAMLYSLLGTQAQASHPIRPDST